MTIITSYLRYIQWPWALALAIMLPLVTGWLVRWGLRARRERLARLGTESMIARLAPSVTQQRTWSAILRAGLATLLLGVAIAGPRWMPTRNRSPRVFSPRRSRAQWCLEMLL